MTRLRSTVRRTVVRFRTGAKYFSFYRLCGVSNLLLRLFPRDQSGRGLNVTYYVKVKNYRIYAVYCLICLHDVERCNIYFFILFVFFPLLQAHRHHAMSIYKVIFALNVRFQNHQTEISLKDCAVFHSGYLQAFE